MPNANAITDMDNGLCTQVLNVSSPDNVSGTCRLAVTDEWNVSNPEPVTVINSGDITPSRYTPKFYTSCTDITLTSQTNWTELANIDFDGQLDGISLNFDRKEVDVQILVDGEIILEADIECLGDTNGCDLRSSGGAIKLNFPIYVKENDKHLIINYGSPPDVINNITINARKNKSSATNMKGISVVYREKVT